MALLYGRAVRLTAKHGGFGLGQSLRAMRLINGRRLDATARLTAPRARGACWHASSMDVRSIPPTTSSSALRMARSGSRTRITACAPVGTSPPTVSSRSSALTTSSGWTPAAPSPRRRTPSTGRTACASRRTSRCCTWPIGGHWASWHGGSRGLTWGPGGQRRALGTDLRPGRRAPDHGLRRGWG